MYYIRTLFGADDFTAFLSFQYLKQNLIGKCKKKKKHIYYNSDIGSQIKEMV